MELELYLVENFFFDAPSYWCTNGIQTSISVDVGSPNIRLSKGKGCPKAEAYLGELTEILKSDINLTLTTDHALESNEVGVQLKGFFTNQEHRHLWDFEGLGVKMRVHLSMTKLRITGKKVFIIECGGLNVEMGFSNPQATGITFPSSLLESRYDQESQGPRLTGTLSISLISDPAIELSESLQVTKRILDGKLCTDLDIVCGDGEVVKCHKAFLAAQSPVFAAMFRSGMQEEKQKKICVEDFNKEGVEGMLRYLYYGDCREAHEDPKLALELLKASHKYNIDILENKMRALILSRRKDWCDLDTALQLYLFTKDLDGFAELKGKAAEFIKAKSAEIPQSEAFDSLFKDERKLGLEMCSFALSR